MKMKKRILTLALVTLAGTALALPASASAFEAKPLHEGRPYHEHRHAPDHWYLERHRETRHPGYWASQRHHGRHCKHRGRHHRHHEVEYRRIERHRYPVTISYEITL
jgi:Ni/Co efflux regulator RcnB